jgi:hypothetical protein
LFYKIEYNKLKIIDAQNYILALGASMAELGALVLAKLMLLYLTDVYPLSTKQYIQVGLQLQYVLHNF